MFLYIRSIPNISYLNPYTLTFYAISYFKNGFMARAFLGTLFNVMGIDSGVKLFCVLFAVTTTFISYISYTLNTFINKFNKKESVFIALLFIFNPASITLIYQNLEIGRMDIFIYILSIISIISIYKEKYLYIIPVLSIIGVLIHENYIVWLTPLICMLLIYKYFKRKEKKYLYVLALNVLVLFVTLLLIKFSGPSYENAFDFYNALRANSTIPVNIFAISDYYYITSERNKELFDILFKIQETGDYVVAGIGFVYTLYLLWNLCFKRVVKEVKNKLLYILMILSCMSPSVLFLLACDYGRWYIYIINAFYTLAMFLYFEYENVFKKEMSKNKIFIPLIIVYIFTFILLYQNDQFYLITYTKFSNFIDLMTKFFITYF